jgi:signal transduction histidine kinase
MITNLLLNRQLHRLGIDPEVLPNQQQWRNFLERIQKTYQENEQDRYLSERAFELSSTETIDLNEKLEHAQEIAHLGYWTYNRSTGKITWSKEMYNLFGADPRETIPTFETLMNRIQEDDRKILSIFIDQAFETGKKFECEAHMKKFTDEEVCLYIAGETHSANGTVHELSGIAMDITRRKQAEAEMHTLNQQLLSSARRAGMSEIATSVLHNIGNILNSVNVSLEVIQQYIKKSEILHIIQGVEMINAHIETLPHYLTQDPKGKLLLQYFISIKTPLLRDYEDINLEISRLNKHIVHIKDIVKMQNTISGVSEIKEQVSLIETIDEAMLLTQDSLQKYGIQLEKKFDSVDTILTDKNKIMQIIVNLIQNAKEALIMQDLHIQKKISMQIVEKQPNVEIIIADNGIGIDNETMSHLFAFGFTTKPKGHGFGLHSSALLAKELGGELRAESNGKGDGAKFVLTIPSNSMERRNHDNPI